MATTYQPTHETAAQEPVNYLNVQHGWKSWLLTTDHKRISLLYLFSITLMFITGGTFAMLVRIHLTQPQGLFAPETYNRLFTMHGVIMVFFFLVPSIPATLGNFLLPIMVGAKDLAFPRINLLSWYLYIGGAAFAIFAVVRGGVDTGWTFYAPYSTTYSNSYVLSAAMGVFFAGFSSITTGLNFIVTVHKMRAPGMSWMRLPLFVWANYATGLIQILGTPVVAIALVLVALERVMHVGYFRSERRRRSDSVSAHFLVLLASGRLHYDSAGHGHHQRSDRLLLKKASLRLRLHCGIEHGYCDSRLPGVGTSHVRHRTEHLHRYRFFVPDILCCSAVGGKGV